MRELTHLSLFSGIGGLDLAAEAAGFRTVGQCEAAEFQTAILERHWTNIPRWKDIRELTGAGFYERTGRRTVDVVSGGFPCQPFSVAGNRRGKADDRYLWPEMLRVIRELRPTWVVGENVAGIVRMALDTVLADLESEDYSCRAFVFPAAAVGAPHRRDRVAICAYTDRNGRTADEHHGESEGLPVSDHAALSVRGGVLWNPECGLDRVVDGVPGKLDKARVQSLGNAVVPAQFYPIFKAIADIERGREGEP